MMDAALLGYIAQAPTDITPSYLDVMGTYSGNCIPFHGIVRVTTTRESLTAEIDDVEKWERLAAKNLPSGSPTPRSLFGIPGRGQIADSASYGQIVPDTGGWEADHAINSGYHSEYGPEARNLATFTFHLGQLCVHGPSYGSEIAATRLIYSGGEWNYVSALGGRTLVVRTLTEKSSSIADEVLSITIEGKVADVDERAIWSWASIISGNALGDLLAEYYAADGSLISRVHRRGNPGLGRRSYFKPFYAPFNADAIDHALNEIASLMREDFPIDVVVTHLLQAVTGTIDTDAVYLVLAYHTAIEGWNALHGFDNWIDKKPWETFANHIRRNLIPSEFYESVGNEMKETLRAILPSASRTTTAWRQHNLFEVLGIDVSSDDARRILRLRNEILHNGYFRPRWDELTSEQRQQRIDDVERLRRLALFVLFRLTGYHGEYLDPVTFERRMLAPQSEGSVTI